MLEGLADALGCFCLGPLGFVEVFVDVGEQGGDGQTRFSMRWTRPTPPARNSRWVSVNDDRGTPARLVVTLRMPMPGLVLTAMSKPLILPMTPYSWPR